MALAFGADLGSTQDATGSTTVALTTANTAAAGSLIVVGITAPGTVSSVSDGTNTYTLLGPATDANTQQAWMAYTYAGSQLTAGATITATFSGSVGDRMIGAISFTGTASSSIQTGSTGTRAANNETSFNGVAITTTDANAVVVGMHHTDGAGNPQAITPNSGFTIQLGGTSPNDEWNFDAGGAQKSACMLYRIVSSTGTYTSGATWDESQSGGSGAHVTAAFKASVSTQSQRFMWMP